MQELPHGFPLVQCGPLVSAAPPLRQELINCLRASPAMPPACVLQSFITSRAEPRFTPTNLGAWNILHASCPMTRVNHSVEFKSEDGLAAAMRAIRLVSSGAFPTWSITCSCRRGFGLAELGAWPRVGGQRPIGSASAIGTIIRNRKTLTVRIAGRAEADCSVHVSCQAAQRRRLGRR